MNDGIEKELNTLSYVSLDDAVSQVRQLGKGTMMAKMDVKSAIEKSQYTLRIGICWA